VATSTVKQHINNIYVRLNVRRRTQAVAKGEEVDGVGGLNTSLGLRAVKWV
jgi:ATP/maltotriose-dependent transcriptional regulator MalT